MPPGSLREPSSATEADNLRQHAARARRFAKEMTNAEDRRLLNELAERFDAEAAELERRG
jgi:hypothetical protein